MKTAIKKTLRLCAVEPHRQEPVAPYNNATSRGLRREPPTGVGGLQVAGFTGLMLLSLILTIAIAADNSKNPFAGNAEAIKAGEKIFDEKCADCHGGDAMGGAGPDLTDDKWLYGGNDADLFTTVSGGRKGGMPAWHGQMKDDEIWKVIAYVRSLAKKNKSQ